MVQRADDFKERSKRLQNMTDEELDRYFWELAEKIVDPLIKLASTHTSPSIERSVLLRMGFNSLEAKAIVEKVVDMGLLGKGAGNIVYTISQKQENPFSKLEESSQPVSTGTLLKRVSKGWDQNEFTTK